MFNKDFFPTPEAVINLMTEGEVLTGKVILEPSAGKGNIVDYLINEGAKDIIACESNEDLKKILATKCKIIESDFFTLTSDKISHIDFIIMNPPFSEDEKHILHAYNIAPPGCKIIALCNTGTLQNDYSKSRKELNSIIEMNGTTTNLDDCFTNAERSTGVKVSLIKIQKAGANYNSEFEGFFMEEEPEELNQTAGLMSYNVVRDLVNRYVAAIKLYDEQLKAGEKMNYLLSGFYGESLTFTCTEKGTPKLRNDFKKDLQKAGWKFIFEKMNLKRHATKGLKEDINKFVEQQTEIPFTMKNIYKMIEIVIGTTSQRMDKAILEAFEGITKHHADNQYHLPGWKTNSHFLLTKKFIVPYMVDESKKYGYTSETYNIYRSSGRYDLIEDLEKALCYLTGEKWDEIKTLYAAVNNNKYGEWYSNHHFFKYKAFKKGTMHFEFKNEEIWGKLNQRVAKLKGYPLFESKQQTAYQNRQTGRPTQPTEKKEPVILSTIKLKTA